MNNEPLEPARSQLQEDSNVTSQLSVVWLLPVMAILFAGWVMWDSYSQRGPLVNITFAKAGGVIAGETRVLRNDVQVGKVESVNLSENLNSVVVGVRMNPQVAPYMDDDARFWIVNARINTTEISGLGTLLSGSYIEVDWDDELGNIRNEFVGLDEPPLTERGTPGLRLTLAAAEAGYIYVGSPVFLRQIEVGRVERRRLSDDATKVLFDIFIEAPYHQNVYPDTRFYSVSGVEGNVGVDGISVRVESIAALFTGGVAFENPPEITAEQPVASGAKRYRLFDSRSEARESLFDGEDDQRYRFVAQFPGSIKGLRANSPIEYNGLVVGRVASVSVDLPNTVGEEGVATAVLQFQPARIGLKGVSQEQWYASTQELVAQGLRVQLSSGNLLTGSLLVKLVARSDLAGTGSIDFNSRPYPSLPVLETNVNGVAADVETLIKNLSKLPLDSLVRAATQLMRDASDLVANPELSSLPRDLSSSLSSIASTALQFEAATADLPALLQTLNGVLRNANEVLEGLTPDSKIYYELTSTVSELRSAAKSIASFAELLEENPNALITGR